MSKLTNKEKSKQALQNLAGLAARHGITQTQIADLILNPKTGESIRQQTVGQTFNARFHPTLDTFIRYLEAINELAGTDYSLADVDYKAADWVLIYSFSIPANPPLDAMPRLGAVASKWQLAEYPT